MGREILGPNSLKLSLWKRWQKFCVPFDFFGFGYGGVTGRGGGKGDGGDGNIGKNLSKFLFYEATGKINLPDFITGYYFLNYWNVVNDIYKIGIKIVSLDSLALINDVSNANF